MCTFLRIWKKVQAAAVGLAWLPVVRKKKIVDVHWLQFFCNLNSPKKLHLLVRQVKNRNH